MFRKVSSRLSVLLGILSCCLFLAPAFSQDTGPTGKPGSPIPNSTAAPSLTDVEDVPLDDPAPPVVTVPPHAPSAADNANFKSSDTPLPATDTTVVAAASGNKPNLTSTNFSAVWQESFMREALFAGVLVALVCGYLGVYVVLKRIVFIGVALSEFSSAGIALALFAGFNPLLGALAFMILGVVLFALHISPRRLPHESFIGIIYVIAGALAILLIAKSHEGETHMLQLLQGDVLLINPLETRQMCLAFAAVMAIHLLFIKPLVLTSFDRAAASTLGFRTQMWEFLLFLTIGLTIAFAIRATGTLMTTTMLILPATTALLLVNRLKWVFFVAPMIAIIPVAIGLHLSYIADLPASAVIVALSFLLFLPVLAINFALKR